MKVLMLGWELPPHNSGGLGVACLSMCQSLSAQGVQIQFILPYTADHAIDFMDVVGAHPQNVQSVLKSGSAYDSDRYVHIKTNGEHESLTLYGQEALYADNVEKIVKLFDFDIIHAHDWLTFRAALAAKKLTNKPLITHIHATEYDRSGANAGNGFVKDIEYHAMMMADKVISVSQATKDILTREYSIPPDKIEVVHNSIDVEDYDHSAINVYTYLTLLKQHGYKVVVNIGRLTIQKGLTHLLEAAQKVVMHRPNTIFLIVGSGEQHDELIMRAAELGISKNIMLAGFQRGQAWRDAFKVADLFVMPSVSEPFGLAPLESISFGTPSLVSHQSGVSEVIKNMLKVDYWNTDEMANQIVSALNSEGLLSTLITESKRELNGLSWSKTANRLQDIYKGFAGVSS